MLKTVNTAKLKKAKGRFAIIASTYNPRFVDSMLGAAEKILRDAGVKNVQVIRVPGAFEIPVVAAKLAEQKPRLDAIICLGVIIRGETAHAQLIGESATYALTQIQVNNLLPVIHEVLLLENTQQAEVRCMDPKHNRGAEAAQTALQMADILKKI
jgi:6,7-dimethyl-8-ribityllumazine synthase